MAAWNPSSWRSFPIAQQPAYPDQQAFDDVVRQLARYPPLVGVNEVVALKAQLAEVAAGRRFLLQGGDCAERFVDCEPSAIEKKLRIMIQMSLVLTWGARCPTVRIGRMAGQFAKPRSKPTEVVDGNEIATFRGDNVNGFDVGQRTPDPQRLLQGYFHAASTLNFARCLVNDGIADMHDASKWDLGFVPNSSRAGEYADMLDRITDSLDFLEVCGVTDSESLRKVDLFTSHEGLGLAYEEAMTRRVDDDFFNLGAHFLWIGDRTRQLDHAHVEYFRGIANPIGVKVGPSMQPDELVQLIRRLWPDPAADPGKITLITRFGARRVRELLPQHVRAVQNAGLPVVWCCDPCHGNTTTVNGNVKTRSFDDILAEVQETFLVHREMGGQLGGVHFELTGENVTECIGGPEGLTPTDLAINYTSYCDPRMNYAQSMELGFLLAHMLMPDRAGARRGVGAGGGGSAAGAAGASAGSSAAEAGGKKKNKRKAEGELPNPRV